MDWEALRFVAKSISMFLLIAIGIGIVASIFIILIGLFVGDIAAVCILMGLTILGLMFVEYKRYKEGLNNIF